MYEKILVPLDGSELAECVLPHVENIIRGGEVREVVFFRVAEPALTSSRYAEIGLTEADVKRIAAESETAARKYLDELVDRVNYAKVNVRSEVVTGKAADSLADFAAKNEVDLIIIATHGRSGISRWVWGSVADRILHSSSVPILMVRPPGCEPKH
ncbi:MAG: universal stress protein [Dehalococcoidales bacterium]